MRTLHPLGRLTLALVLSGVALPTGVFAQRTAPSPDYEVPRTAWGHPDLQGNWSNASLTPFQRPAGEGPVMSPEQVAELEQGAEEYLEDAREASDPDRGAPPAGGDGSTGAAGMVGGYNAIYIDRGESVAWVRGEPRSSLVTRPDDGRVPDMTEEGQAARMEAFSRNRGFGQYDHPELRPLGERCIMSFGSTAGPPMVPNGFYNNNYTIVQNEDHVLIHTEMVHDTRIIQLGDRPDVPDEIRPWMGVSWGHWEGDTLVVETTNIHPEQRFQGAPSDNLTVHERFTRVDDETVIYEFTIDDPSSYTEPWGGEVPFVRLDGLVHEYACHEGNYALSNILSGARYQERQEAEAQEQSEPR